MLNPKEQKPVQSKGHDYRFGALNGKFEQVFNYRDYFLNLLDGCCKDTEMICSIYFAIFIDSFSQYWHGYRMFVTIFEQVSFCGDCGLDIGCDATVLSAQ